MPSLLPPVPCSTIIAGSLPLNFSGTTTSIGTRSVVPSAFFSLANDQREKASAPLATPGLSFTSAGTFGRSSSLRNAAFAFSGGCWEVAVAVKETGDPLNLLGHSFGGLVTRAAVLADPGMFTSFTLLGSGPSHLTGRRADLLDHLGPLLDAGGVQLVHETLEQVAMTDPKAQAVPAPTREFYTRRFLRNSEAGLRGMADAMLSEPDRVPELAATGVPLLVAHGEADDAWLPHVQADMAQRLGARHEVINNSIHSPAVENPARTLEALLDFWAVAAAGFPRS